jgi:hypothetical protein
VDDTEARHKGKNGYRAYIGNEVFSWFESTGRKDRINFLRYSDGLVIISDDAGQFNALCWVHAERLVR